jgi:hypothetical protein
MQELPPPAVLLQLVLGCAHCQAVIVAARLGIADILSEGPLPVDEIARRAKVDADALYRVLRALASIGVFVEHGPRLIGLTPAASLLQSKAPGSMRSFVLMWGEHFSAWSELLHSVTTGRPAFEKAFGQPLFDYLAEHPESAKTFDAAMTGIHGPETGAMIEAYPFDSFDTIVDIGGGNGSVLLEVLRSAPRARGVVFDLPHVVERTSAILAKSDLARRCSTRGGSFFESVPAGADAYILRHIIHDWDDDRAVQILARCREAMEPGGRVLIVESVIAPGNDPHPGKWLDVIMLAIPGGRERTQEEYRRLFTRAGLKLSRIVPTQSPVSVVEAVAA